MPRKKLIVRPLVAPRSHLQHNRNVIGGPSRLLGSATATHLNISIPHQIPRWLLDIQFAVDRRHPKWTHTDPGSDGYTQNTDKSRDQFWIFY